MASELCMHCFNVKGNNTTCPYCGYVEGTPPQQAFHLTPGTILANRYIVGTCIGFGGFGITYKAYDTILGVIVAIKEFYPVGLVNRAPGETRVGVMSGEKMGEYNIQLQRFLMEAQNIAQFGKAKDIVNVYDYFEENGTAYIIMEYIEGILLKEYMEQEGQMDVETALYLIMPIIEALKKIHGSGIIHRDVSPDNIFITNDGAIKIFDFGAAQFAGESGETASEAVIKAGYAPPEQYRSKSKQGPFSDIYSVGAILYEMITGVKPMEASDRTAKDTLVPPSQLGIKLDPNLDRAIMQAMAVRQEYRFQYVEHLQEAIEDKRVAEYPEEKMKRLRKKRRLAISITLSSLVACIAVALALVRWMQQGNAVLNTPLETCKLTVWAPYEGSMTEQDAVSQMELLFTDFKSKENCERFPGNEKVTFECFAIPAAQYEEELEKAKTLGTEPDIYCTDFVADANSLGLQELYEVLEEENYFGLSNYIEAHPEMKSIPFGLQTMCVYTFGEKTDAKVADIQEVLTEENKKKVYVDEKKLGNVLVMQDNTLLKSSPIAVTDNAKSNFDVLKSYTNILGLSEQTQWIAKTDQSILETITDTSDKKKEVSAVITDTDFQKILHNYNTTNYDKMIQYDRKLLTVDGASLFVYRDTFAVNEKLAQDENARLAAQRFLYLALSESLNRAYYSGTIRMIPVNRLAWENENTPGAYNDSLLETLAKEKIVTVYTGHNDLYVYGKNVLDELAK